MDKDEDEKVVGKESYQRLLRVITAQTGGDSLPIAIPESTVKQIYMGYIGNDNKTWKQATSMAVNKGHIVRLQYNNELRDAVTVEGVAEIQQTTPYADSDVKRMDELVEEAVCFAPESVGIEEWVQQQKNYLKHID